MTEPATLPVTLNLQQFRYELAEELRSILDYWIKYAQDEAFGGFYGSINNENIPGQTADKGLVLNSRILWTFSAAYHSMGEAAYLQIAERAYDYIITHFADKEYGGVYWSVNYEGKTAEKKKQIYGQAFCIYGLAEYYRASGNPAALELAKELFDLTEQKSFDKEYGGYFEAFTREWQMPDDMRLSAKDENEKKTANTHLHIIEAYANLYRAWPDNKLKQKILGLLDLFEKYFINKQTFHLNLFFDEAWNSKTDLVSYGHDIEAAWLLLECAEVIGERKYAEQFGKISLSVSNAALEGMDGMNGLWYEFFPSRGLLIKEKHWWVQNEAMIGFFNAWQLSGEQRYLDASVDCWSFSKSYLMDKKNGEWFWGVDENNRVLAGKEKAGFWKCPYHNGRACMELIKRTDATIN